MTFYGFKIPDDRKHFIEKLKRTPVGSCIEGSCDNCPIRFDGDCLACNTSIMYKYDHLKYLGSSTRRDVLYREYFNLGNSSFLQEELEI